MPRGILEASAQGAEISPQSMDYQPRHASLYAQYHGA